MDKSMASESGYSFCDGCTDTRVFGGFDMSHWSNEKEAREQTLTSVAEYYHDTADKMVDYMTKVIQASVLA